MPRVPFEKQASQKGYYYFDLNYITRKLDFTNRLCDKARRLVKSKQVVLVSVDQTWYREDPDSPQRMGLYVKGCFDSGRGRLPITIDVRQNKICSAECSGFACRAYYEAYSWSSSSLCEHVVALLYLLEDYILEHNPGDATDAAAENIFRRFRRQRVNTAVSESADGAKLLKFEPRLEDTDVGLAVSFRVGTDRLYIIKDITKFVEQMDAGETVTFGKNTTIALAACRMDDFSQKLYDLMKAVVMDRRDKQRRMNLKRSYYEDSVKLEVKANIELSGARLDEFYHIMSEPVRAFEYCDKSEGYQTSKLMITCRDGMLRPDLQVAKYVDTRRIFQGVRVTGEVSAAQEGAEAFYAVVPESKCMLRMDKDKMRDILPIYEMAGADGQVNFSVGRKYLSEFYYTVLPMLKKSCNVTEKDTDVIEEYVPEEAVFRFFLDEEQNVISCRGESVYGESVFPLTDALSEERAKNGDTLRDYYREGEVARRVAKYLPETDSIRGTFLCERADEEAVYRLLSEGVPELMELGEVHSTDRFKRIGIRRSPKIRVGVSIESDIMNLSVSSDDLTPEELMEVLSQYKKKKKFFRLKSGDFINLEENSLDALGQLMDAVQASPREFVRGKMQIPAYRALYLDRMLEETNGIYSERDSHFRSLVKEFKTVNDSDFEVPESMRKVMRNYQITGYKWLRTLAAYGFGGILADDMGLGKTLQVLAVVLALKEEYGGTTEPVVETVQGNIAVGATGNGTGNEAAVVATGNGAGNDAAVVVTGNGAGNGAAEVATGNGTGNEVAEVATGNEAAVVVTENRLGSDVVTVAEDKGLENQKTAVAVQPTAKRRGRPRKYQAVPSGQPETERTTERQAVKKTAENDTVRQNTSKTWLIVCPASLVYNWKEETAKFAPSLSVCLVVGTQKEREEKIRTYQEYDILVTSYDLLKRDIDRYEDCAFAGEVIDEAQFIKNHTTAAAKAVKLIRSRIRYALTGTPIENRLSELWSIFDYLMPGFLYGYDTFRKELETPIVKYKDEAASARLRRMVSPFILRRLKKDVLKDLPEKLEKVYYAQFEPEQQKLYDGQVAHMQSILRAESDENFGRDKIKILAELTRIRQVCCDPSLIYEDYTGGSAKREACMALIRQAMEGEHKILLFSQFTSMLALLERDLAAENVPYYKITGETPKKTRLELVNAFNGDDTPLFLISLKAGGTGLNLTGADVVIHYDPWWNLAVQNQATDRAHRIGQTNVVSVYRLIVRDTIEEKILALQEEKKDLAEEILSGENGGLAQLSKDELIELLQV